MALWARPGHVETQWLAASSADDHLTVGGDANVVGVDTRRTAQKIHVIPAMGMALLGAPVTRTISHSHAGKIKRRSPHINSITSVVRARSGNAHTMCMSIGRNPVRFRILPSGAHAHMSPQFRQTHDTNACPQNTGTRVPSAPKCTHHNRTRASS